MATALRQPAAANIQRVSDFDLAGIIEFQRSSIREKKYSLFGRLTNLRMGLDDRAEYFQGEAFKRLCLTNKVIGHTIEWPAEKAPVVAWAMDRSTLLFPDGIQHAPSISVRAFMRVDVASKHLPPGVKWDGSQVIADKGNGRVRQDIFDFASGSLNGRDGSRFAILQPVEQAVVLANVTSSRFRSNGTLMNCHGKPTFDGRHPFLLVSPFSREAYLAGGRFDFDAI